MKKRNWMSIVALMMVLVLAVCVTACKGKTEEEQPAEEPKQEEEAEPRVDLTADERDSLVAEAANESTEIQYAEYFDDDDLFAKAEVFGVDRDGDKGKMYVYMYYGEYVALEDKAYEVAGGAGEAIINFKYTDDGVDYEKIEWSADGSDHEDWMKKNFPDEYLKKSQEYDPQDEDGKNKLAAAVANDVKKEFGVPVETENILEIDTENATYRVLKTIESGDPADDTYKFDTEVVDEGDLEVAED